MISNDSMITAPEANSSLPGRPSPHPAQLMVLWVVPLLEISLNLLVFIVVPRIKTLRVSTTAGMLSLAVTDFAMGMTALVNMSYNTYSGFEDTIHPLCAVLSYSLTAFASVSVAMLAYLNIDRLLTFRYPLKYRLSRKKVIIINIAIWVGNLAFHLPNVTDTMGFKYYEYAFVCLPIWKENNAYKTISVVVLLVTPTVISLVCFCGSFCLIRSRHRQMSVRIPDARVHCGRQLSERTQWNQDKKTFKALAIMTFGFYIAWFPYAITMALPEIITGHTLHPVTDFITPHLAGSNSFWNPIIYMLTLRSFTMALSQLCKKTPSERSMSTEREQRAGRPSVTSLDTTTTDTNIGGSMNAVDEQGIEEQQNT